jgi:hypothetical protein
MNQEERELRDKKFFARAGQESSHQTLQTKPEGLNIKLD